MLTEALNLERSLKVSKIVKYNKNHEIEQDTLESIAANTMSMKQLEAQLASIISINGLQNSKQIEDAKAQYQKKLEIAKKSAESEILAEKRTVEELRAKLETRDAEIN